MSSPQAHKPSYGRDRHGACDQHSRDAQPVRHFFEESAPLNPLLAINGVLRERFDMWDRYRIAYQQLTTLNQDVIYALPKTIWPSVGLNIFVGVWGLVLFPKQREL